MKLGSEDQVRFWKEAKKTGACLKIGDFRINTSQSSTGGVVRN